MTVVPTTLPAPAGGMVVGIAAQELDDTQARYIQDGLVDIPGFLRRRGPVRATQGETLAALPRKGTGIVGVLNPLGQDRYGVFTGTGANGYFTAYSEDFSSVTDLAWPYALPTDPDGSSPYRIVDAKAAIGGGVLMGVSSQYDSESPEQGIALWRGGIHANYTTGTLTVARGSASVTGSGTSWSSNVSPGMFLFANTDDPYTSAYVGVVQTVNSNTSITLEKISPYAATAKAYTLQALRGLAPQIQKGRITCDTASATVNGGDTKFVDHGLAATVWNIYRRSDFKWIGKVNSVASNTQLTLAANATAAMADEEYVALKADADFSIVTTASTAKPGFLNATYADRQWYLNNGRQHDDTYTLWYSDKDNPEALDLLDEGDNIKILSSGPINFSGVAVAASYNALLVFKENETFGIFGASPTQFSRRKIEDDGALSGMSVQQFGGGVIWAGREGIHYYDGISVDNLTKDKLGDVWKTSVKTFDPTTYRMWSMMARDHYFLFVERLTPTVAVVKDSTSYTPERWTVVINMVTRAVTMMTNLNIRGAIGLPDSQGRDIWFLVNDDTRGIICAADDLFDVEGVDTIDCDDDGRLGPDWYWETKKFDLGDGLLRKKYTGVLVHYLAQGGAIMVDAVLGLNDVGRVLPDSLPASVQVWNQLPAQFANWDAMAATYPTWFQVVGGVFLPKKLLFDKRNQYIALRFYQANSSMTRVKMGPYQILGKPMRVART